MQILAFIAVLFATCTALSEKCKEDLQKCTASTTFTGLPLSMQQVNELCTAFNTGMACINEIKKTCLSDEKKRQLEKQTAETGNFMKLLCNVSSFQGEYLSHTGCFGAVSHDWIYCTDVLKETVNEVNQERSKSYMQKLVDNCCARHGFNMCVTRSSRAKCDRPAAIFLRRISESLSREAECNAIDVDICGSVSHKSMGLATMLIFVFIRMAFERIQNR